MAETNIANGPDFSFEESLLAQDFVPAGVDEVGRGPLAGPVVAASVILDPYRIPDGLNDSKKLSRRRREVLFDGILQSARAVAVASVGPREIDRTDIRKASLEAMRRAVASLSVSPGHVLVDGNALPARLGAPATAIVKGDARCLSIAAASIVAKVMRDRMMDRACLTHPGYGFSGHAGYGTPAHLKAIQELGPTPLHRMSFRPLKAA